MPEMIPRQPILTQPALTRRGLIGAAGGVGLMAGMAPARAAPAAMTLPEALAARRSTRAFAPRDIDPDLRMQILWAAFGINRKDVGGHTAPSWHGAADSVLHLADAAGVWRHDPLAERLEQVLARDIRPVLSPQPFVATAPVCLIHVSDLGRLARSAGATPPPAEELRQNAHVDSAIVAQNVYLICAALGLGTCLVGGADTAAIASALGLGEDRLVTFVQPVGWPAG